MARPAPLIDNPDDVTPEWLTDALVGSGRVPAGARVTLAEPTVIGRGKVGQNVRFVLTWADVPDGVEAPPSVVAKFASDDPTSRQTGLMTGTYVREVAFYQEVADRVTMSIPVCHVAELDQSSGAFVLLFDDITPADTGDQVAGCTVDDAALAMEQLACLHADFWGDTSLEGGTWLVRRSVQAAALAGMYQALQGMFLERYGPRLSATAAEVVERFGPLVERWTATDHEPLTLLHGDYRLENMLFGRGAGVPPLTVVDWQTPNIGAGPSDAAYFLGGGLDVDLRRGHERELLEVYRGGLASRGVDIGADDCWDSYRRNTVAGVHMTVVASVLVGEDEHGREMFLAMIERAASHATDLGTLDLLEA